MLTLNPCAWTGVRLLVSGNWVFRSSAHIGWSEYLQEAKTLKHGVFFCRKSEPLNSGNSSGKLKTQGHTMGNSPSNNYLLLLSKVAVPLSALSLGTNELVQSVFESFDARNLCTKMLVVTHNS